MRACTRRCFMGMQVLQKEWVDWPLDVPMFHGACLHEPRCVAMQVLQKERVGYPSDIWALGVTLNELATGTFPYSDCTRDNPAAHTVLEMGYGRSAGAVLP